MGNARPVPLSYTNVKKTREMSEQRLCSLETLIGKERMTCKTVIRRAVDEVERKWWCYTLANAVVMTDIGEMLKRGATFFQ